VRVWRRASLHDQRPQGRVHRLQHVERPRQAIAVGHWAMLVIAGFDFVLIGQWAAGGSRGAAMSAVAGMTTATRVRATPARAAPRGLRDESDHTSGTRRRCGTGHTLTRWSP